MTYIYSFEKLHVWHEARTMVMLLYTVSKRLPDAEKYGLISQMRRASISVVSNIAEGSGRTSPKDQAHFYQLAFSSLIELLNQLIISCDLGFVTIDEIKTLRLQIEMVSNKLNSLRKSRFANV